MEIIAGTSNFKLEYKTAVAIGKFDGIHIGHKKLLGKVLEQKANGLKSCVFTFDPTPAELFGKSDGRELTTLEEKRVLFEQMGIDILIEFPLTFETAAMEPEVFVRRVLAEQMRAAYIAAGTDISFGAKGAGNAELLKELAPELGFEIETIDKVCVNGTEVSSSYIRELLKEGRLEEVKECLGNPFTLMGRVVHGNRIGRTIGFPTVNLEPGRKKLLPPNGVYYSGVKVKGEEYRAISNIGYKPTVAQEPVLGVETYLYDFDEDIYEESVEVYLYAYKRPERKFESLEALKQQLAQDIEGGMYYGI